jgi:hypothetical protein
MLSCSYQQARPKTQGLRVEQGVAVERRAVAPGADGAEVSIALTRRTLPRALPSIKLRIADATRSL